MIYAGIGARKTPPTILGPMTAMARFMAASDHTLRSGGAEGADMAFEAGCDLEKGPKEIYLPYKDFRGNSSPLFGTTKEARYMASQFHPNWPNVGSNGRDYLGRNMYQIMGHDLETPCKFVICWTVDGKLEGGTSTAIRCALGHDIPVFNLGKMSLNEANERISDLL